MGNAKENNAISVGWGEGGGYGGGMDVLKKIKRPGSVGGCWRNEGGSIFKGYIEILEEKDAVSGEQKIISKFSSSFCTNCTILLL